MKKMLFALAALFLFVSCTPSVQDVVTKYKEHKDLTEKDYGVALDYAEGPMKDYEKLLESNVTDPEKLIASAEELEKKYPEMGEVLTLLYDGFTSGKLQGDVKSKTADLVRRLDTAMARLQSMLLSPSMAPSQNMELEAPSENSENPENSENSENSEPSENSEL